MNEIKIPDCHTKLLPCPFCGNDSIHITKKPLWTEYMNRDTNKKVIRGYGDCYEFEVICDKCGAHPTYYKNDTIYRPEEEAISHVVNVWNKRVLNSFFEPKPSNEEETKDESGSDGESIESCIKIIDDTDWLLTKVLDIEQRGKLHSIAFEATRLLRKLNDKED